MFFFYTTFVTYILLSRVPFIIPSRRPAALSPQQTLNVFWDACIVYFVLTYFSPWQTVHVLFSLAIHITMSCSPPFQFPTKWNKNIFRSFPDVLLHLVSSFHSPTNFFSRRPFRISCFISVPDKLNTFVMFVWYFLSFQFQTNCDFFSRGVLLVFQFLT